MRFATVCCCLLMVPLSARAEKKSADEILSTARYVTTLQQQDLTGRLRKDDRRIPVGLYLRRQNVQLTYHAPNTGKAVRFHMRHGDKQFDLFEMVDNKTKRFPDSKLGQPIEGTDLSYEDLAMRFLYWPKGVVEGEDKIKGQECWQLRLVNPTGKGRYAQVRVWVHKKSQALMKVVGYDAKGRPLKRFQVTDIMKVGDTYTLKRMRVDTIEPVANKVAGLTYLEFDKPKPVGPPKKLK